MIRRFCFQERFDKGFAKSQLDLLWTMAKTGFPIGGAIGSFLVSPLISLLGPRKSLFYSHVSKGAMLTLSSFLFRYDTPPTI